MPEHAALRTHPAMPPSDRLRLVVLVSGTGSLLQALLRACGDPDYPADVVAVGSDRHGIRGLNIARDAGRPTFVTPLDPSSDRSAWDRQLAEDIGRFHPDLVVSAGFMRILGTSFLEAFPDAVVNTHPALLPAFPGAHAVADAIAYGVTVSGCTIHLVDAGVDTGPVIAQRPVAVERDDDEASLHERIKAVERALLIDVVDRMARGGWHVSGRRVVIGGGHEDHREVGRPGAPVADPDDGAGSQPDGPRPQPDNEGA